MQKRNLGLAAVGAFVILALLYNLYLQDNAPWRERTTVEQIKVGNHFVYMPIISHDFIASMPSPKKGASSIRSCEDAILLRVMWTYDWWVDPIQCPGLDSVPMVRDRQAFELPIGGNSDYIMLFNEPDLGLPQADVTILEAVTMTHQIHLTYPDKKLIAPVPSQYNPSWLTVYRQTYIDTYGVPPPVVGIALHCYSVEADECIEYVRMMVGYAINWEMKEVWVTEFAYTTGMNRTINDTITELRKFLDYLDSEPMITRYSPYTTYNPGDYFEWGGWSYEQVAPLLTYRIGAFTPYGRVYAEY